MADCSNSIQYNKYTKLEDARLLTGIFTKKDTDQRDSRTPTKLLIQVINDRVDEEIKKRNEGRSCPRGCDYVGSKVIHTKEGFRTYQFYWSEQEWITDDNGHNQLTRIKFRALVAVKLKLEVVEVFCEEPFEPSLEDDWSAINWDREDVYANYLETGLLPTEDELIEKT